MTDTTQRRPPGIGIVVLTLMDVMLFTALFVSLFFVSGYFYQLAAQSLLMMISVHFPAALLVEARARRQLAVLVTLSPLALLMWIAIGCLNLSYGLLDKVWDLLNSPYSTYR